ADREQVIVGDVNSLVQILDNVIDNAIQAYNGRSGTIQLRVEQVGDDIRFSVSDQGDGIPPEIEKLLFKEMVTTKGKHGTGLGLYMSHSTVKGMFRGNMWLETKLGEGTTFFIQIPLTGK
ncbi:MAG: ATP-binding protein, partial [Coriobacteriaceae bacterium]|nr:ATP-binding protein [Coriobacteriaceae bacterium]